MSNYEHLFVLVSQLIKEIDITISLSKTKLTVNTIYYRIVYNIDDSIFNAWKNTIRELKIVDNLQDSGDLCNEIVLHNTQQLYDSIVNEVSTSTTDVENTIRQEGYLSLLKAYIRYNSSIGMDDISLYSKNLTVGEAIMLRKIKYD